MALLDTATLSIGTGDFYTGAVDAAAPTDLSSIASPTWTRLGHTSQEDIFTISSDGGDATSLGTLQAPVLRTKYSPRVETFTIQVEQMDLPNLKLYFGSNMSLIPGSTLYYGVPSAPTITVSAFLCVFKDGSNHFSFYAPKAEIFRGDDMDFSDTESLVALPLNIKPVQSGTNTFLYAVTPLS